jgi:hypothetical protein
LLTTCGVLTLLRQTSHEVLRIGAEDPRVEDREEPQAGSTSHRPLTVSARGNPPWHLFLMAGLAVAVFALAWSEVGASASSSRVSRQVVLAQRGVVQSTVSGTGNVEAGTDVSVNFQASGTLADVFVKVGDHVSQGTALSNARPDLGAAVGGAGREDPNRSEGSAEGCATDLDLQLDLLHHDRREPADQWRRQR